MWSVPYPQILTTDVRIENPSRLVHRLILRNKLDAKCDCHGSNFVRAAGLVPKSAAAFSNKDILANRVKDRDFSRRIDKNFVADRTGAGLGNLTHEDGPLSSTGVIDHGL